MFRTQRTLRFRKEHIKAIHAIMQTLGLKIKHYQATSKNAYEKVVFKANEKELMDLITKLDKYGIMEAYL